MKFEEMRDLYEKSDKYKIFFELMAERDTPEMQSLTGGSVRKKDQSFLRHDERPAP